MRRTQAEAPLRVAAANTSREAPARLWVSVPVTERRKVQGDRTDPVLLGGLEDRQGLLLPACQPDPGHLSHPAARRRQTAPQDRQDPYGQGLRERQPDPAGQVHRQPRQAATRTGHHRAAGPAAPTFVCPAALRRVPYGRLAAAYANR